MTVDELMSEIFEQISSNTIDSRSIVVAIDKSGRFIERNTSSTYWPPRWTAIGPRYASLGHDLETNRKVEANAAALVACVWRYRLFAFTLVVSSHRMLQVQRHRKQLPKHPSSHLF